MKHYHFKIVIVGDSSVGKSNILTRYADNEFIDDPMATIGVDVRFKNIIIRDSVVKLQMWDTSGQERFKSIMPAYYRGADFVIYVYNINDVKSFDNIGMWIKDVEKIIPNVQKQIVGNKSDLERSVSYEDGNHLAIKHGCYFLETSAKLNNNIELLFNTIANTLLTTHKDNTNKVYDDYDLELLSIDLLQKPDKKCCFF